jgi:hypothetical protein
LPVPSGSVHSCPSCIALSNLVRSGPVLCCPVCRFFVFRCPAWSGPVCWVLCPAPSSPAGRCVAPFIFRSGLAGAVRSGPGWSCTAGPDLFWLALSRRAVFITVQPCQLLVWSVASWPDAPSLLVRPGFSLCCSVKADAVRLCPRPVQSGPALSIFSRCFLVQSSPVLFCLVATPFLRPSPVLSCPVLFCSVWSCPTLSGPVFCPVWQRPVLSLSERSGLPRFCFVLLCPVLLFCSLLTCPFRSGPILYCSVLSGPVLPRSFLPGSARSSPVWSRPGLSCRALSGPVPRCPLLFCSVSSVLPRLVRLFGSVLSCLVPSRPIWSSPVVFCPNLPHRSCPGRSWSCPVVSGLVSFFCVLSCLARPGPAPF